MLLVAGTTVAQAESRSATFGVSVRVVATLRSRTPSTAPPAAFVIEAGRASLPCGTPMSSGCQAAVAAAAHASDLPVVLTAFTDGTPGAVVER
jgi:hypothetical protein